MRFTEKTVKKDAHGTLRMPVYDSVAFEHETAENMQAAFEGRMPSHSYSRISNPTIEDYEQRVRLLSDALGVIAVSSGMAAISNVILALAEAGTNIVTSRSLFGNTYSLFESTLRPWVWTSATLTCRMAQRLPPQSMRRPAPSFSRRSPIPNCRSLT